MPNDDGHANDDDDGESDDDDVVDDMFTFTFSHHVMSMFTFTHTTFTSSCPYFDIVFSHQLETLRSVTVGAL